MHGCDGPTKVPLFHVDDWAVHECPGKLITEETEDFMMVYGMCKLMSSLPEAGGTMDQVSTFYHGATIVESVVREVEEEQMKASSK